MIDNIYILKKSFTSEFDEYLFLKKKSSIIDDQYFNDLYFIALREIGKMNLDSSNQLDELSSNPYKISKDVRVRDGSIRHIDLIKSLKIFPNQYEIRFDAQNLHIRLTFCTISNSITDEGVSLNYVLDKSDYNGDKKATEDFLNSLVNDSEFIIRILNKKNFKEWLS